MMPAYLISRNERRVVLRNYEGLLVNYPEPGFEGSSSQGEQDAATGVWELSCGKASAIQPANTNRGQRRQVILEKKKKLAARCEDSFLFDL